MAEVTQVDRKIRMDQWDIIKFQLLTHCYINRIKVTDSDLSCLSLLGILGERNLEEFCDITVHNEIYSSRQSTRNSLMKLYKKGLVSRSGLHRKWKIRINPVINIQTSGNILLNLKVLYAEVTNKPILESQEI